jgi:RNA recognition motif. (a.k.a. RRM, RBD, or RNP domain)
LVGLTQLCKKMFLLHSFYIVPDTTLHISPPIPLLHHVSLVYCLYHSDISRQALSRVTGRAVRSIAISPTQSLTLTRTSLRPSFAFSSQRLPLIYSIKSFSTHPSLSQPGAVQPFLPNGHPANENLYVGNLFFDTTPDQLSSYFSNWGKVVSVKIPTDVRGFVRG